MKRNVIEMSRQQTRGRGCIQRRAAECGTTLVAVFCNIPTNQGDCSRLVNGAMPCPDLFLQFPISLCPGSCPNPPQLSKSPYLGLRSVELALAHRSCV